MARHKKHNPERRAWRGKSYRKGRLHIRVLREGDAFKHDGRALRSSTNGERHDDSRR